MSVELQSEKKVSIYRLKSLYNIKSVRFLEESLEAAFYSVFSLFNISSSKLMISSF